MKKSGFVLLIIATSFIMYSCDAFLVMPYEVHNEAGEIIKLKIKNFPLGLYEYVQDTIIELKPDSNLIIGYGDAIGFPWETKKIYKKDPGVENFELLIRDTIIPVNKSDDNWKYAHGASIYKIEKKHLVQP